MEDLNLDFTAIFDGLVVFGRTNLFTIVLILVIALFRKPIGRAIAGIAYRLSKKLLAGFERQAFVEKLTKPIAFFILVVGVYEGVATMIIAPELLLLFHIGEFLLDIITKVYQLLLIFAIARLVLAVLDIAGLVLVSKAEETDDKRDDQIIHFGIEVVKIVFLIMVLLFAVANIFDMNISSLIAGLGIGGLALALAAKESLENLLGSFTIFFDKPFTVGDMVTVSGITGVVEKVGFRSTRLRTLEKSFVTVPNKKMVDAELDNLTLRTFRRVKTTVGLMYGTKIEQIQAIVNDIQTLLDKHEFTNEDGTVRFMDFGASSLDLNLTYFINTMDWDVYLDVKQEINFEIMRIVERHGSDFAFPTQTIHIASNTNKEQGE